MSGETGLATHTADPDDLSMLRARFGDGGDPLGWERVRDFEHGHAVVLPEPYRTFAAEISDGSPEGPPDHGLLGLGQLPADWGADRPRRLLAEPFPLTEAWIWEDEAQPEAEWEERLDAVYDRGSLVLGTDGCGMYWHLIVTGPHRGHIWSITGEGAAPFGTPFGSTTGQPGFAGWVRHWTQHKEWRDA